MGAALGGEVAARHLPTLGFKSSADTLLRLVHHAQVDAASSPRVVVTKLKILKPQMYGRASVALRRQRLLLAAQDGSRTPPGRPPKGEDQR